MEIVILIILLIFMSLHKKNFNDLNNKNLEESEKIKESINIHKEFLIDLSKELKNLEEKSFSNYEDLSKKLEEEILNTNDNIENVLIKLENNITNFKDDFYNEIESVKEENKKQSSQLKNILEKNNLLEEEIELNNRIPDLIHLNSGDFNLKPIEFKKINKNIEIENDTKLKAFILNEGVKAGVTATTIKSMSGLYKATANPEKLMKLADGTIGSAVLKEGKIVKQAGFASVNTLKNFSPLIVMQVLSAITGQYYMNRISNQLNEINKKLDLLIHMHHNEKFSILQAEYEILFELSQKKTYGIEDLNDVRSIYRESKYIYKEYANLINTDTDRPLYKEKKLKIFDTLTSSRLDEIKEHYIEENLDTKSTILLLAKRIHLTSKLMELKINANLSKVEIFRVDKVQELLKNIEKISEEFQEIDEKINPVFNQYIASCNTIYNEASLNKTGVNKQLQDFKDTLENITSEITELTNESKATYLKLKDNFNKEREVYIVIDNEKNMIPLIPND